MAKEFAKAFYRSVAWKKCRAAYIALRIAIDGGLCEHCREKLGYIVDHIIELTPYNINDPAIALNHDNLQYLCLECHNRKTFGSGNSYILTADGDIQPLPPSKKSWKAIKTPGPQPPKNTQIACVGGVVCGQRKFNERKIFTWAKSAKIIRKKDRFCAICPTMSA